MKGSIPFSLTRSSSLVILVLQYNNLSGSIPDSWDETGDKSYKLQFLTIDHNLITGNILVSFSKLGLLQELSFSHNQISGSIPTELGKLSGWQNFDFSYNAINGSSWTPCP